MAGHRLPRRRERDDRRGDGAPRRRRCRRTACSTSCAAPGTLLVERLSAGPAADAVGVDLSADALTASSENLGAGAAVDARLLQADCTGPALIEAVGTGWDLLLADPPWGTLHGTHATNAEVHAGLLQAAYDAAAPGARFVVLTHEVKVMERCLRDADALWRVRYHAAVFAKGHHPRIYVLDRT